jgi:hypothetical protein
MLAEKAVELYGNEAAKEGLFVLHKPQTIEISLEPVYRNLFAALTKFEDLSLKMIKCYASRHIEIKEVKELREPNLIFKTYNYSEEAKIIKKHIETVKEYRVGDGKGGIIEPAEATIDLLDSYLRNVDGYMYVDNNIMIDIFDLILRNKLYIEDIKEYKLFYTNVYMDLCSAVKSFYINVIQAIGEDADYKHSPIFVVDYFKRKGIEHEASTRIIMPPTKNMFGEDLHEGASGTTVTVNRVIDKVKFDAEIDKRQSNTNEFRKEMEKFMSVQNAKPKKI